MSNFIKIVDPHRSFVVDLDKITKILPREEEDTDYNIIYNSSIFLNKDNNYVRSTKTVDELYDLILIHQKKNEKR